MTAYSAKSELRRLLISKRPFIENREERDRLLREKLINAPYFREASMILTYVSFGYEIDTLGLLEYCFSCEIPVAVPRVEGSELSFYRIEGLSGLVKGVFGCMEPVGGEGRVLDFRGSLCITPALAYDGENYRLGYGGGYYDRFLSDFTGISVGLCYRENVIEFPREEHDIPIHIVVRE